jgi:hypothetical protein
MAYLGTKPANQVIDSTLIADGTVTTADIADGAITNAKIASMAASKLTGQLPDANAPSGSVIQVVQTIKTDTFTANLGATFADITGLSVSITPISSTSKILILSTTVIGSTTNGWLVGTRLVRDSTPIFVGDTASSRPRLSGNHISNNSNNDARTVHVSVLDSPATTSAVTYKVQAYAEGTGTTVTVNRSGGDGDNNYNGRFASSIIVMEIAG